MDDDDYWFLPKRYGYGAGPPVAWQGWVLIGVFTAFAIGAGLLLVPEQIWLFIALLLIATFALSVVTASKTRGGWRWRWGEDD